MLRASTRVLGLIVVTTAGWNVATAGPERPAPTVESARLVTLGAIDVDEGKALVAVWLEGRGWTPNQAEAAKLRLAADPLDLGDRLRLIGWASSRPVSAKEHLDLILGLVDVHAADRVGTVVASLLKSAASDEATWTVVEASWRAQATAHADSASVLANAGYFLWKRVGDDDKRDRAGQALLLRAHALDPAEWRWTSVLSVDAAYRVFIEGERMTPEAAREALRLLLDLEKTKPTSVKLSMWFAQGDLPRAIADAAIRAGDLDEAERRARAVLAAATPEECSWDCGNLVHAMHQILGTVALARGNVDDAKTQLLVSGRIPGSPQLDSFGPHFRLARDLFARGEKAAVLEYLALCAKFWKLGSDDLAKWRETIEAGGTPDVGLHAAPAVQPKAKSEAEPRPPSAGKPVGFVGLWESLETSKGGIGHAMELRTDGTGSVSMMVLVNAQWTLKGDSLEIVGTDGGEPEVLPVGRITEDAWFIAGPDRVEVAAKRRVGMKPEGAAPIVGVWSSSLPGFGTSYERYDASGWMSLRLPMAGITEGTWSFMGGTLSLAFKGRPRGEMAATIRGDRLSLTDAEGKVTEYRYAGPTSWYPFGGGK